MKRRNEPRAASLACLTAAALVAHACSPGLHTADATVEAGPDAAVDAAPPPPVQVRMDFTRAGGLFAAPFPSEDRRTADGHHVDVHDYPNPNGNATVDQMLALIASDADGFAATAEIAFALTGAPSTAALPDAHASMQAGSPVGLVSVDRVSPDYLRRYPVSVAYDDAPVPFGAAHLLTALPVQGIPLRPSTLYAAYVLRSLEDSVGRPLDVAPAMAQLVAGTMPAGMSAAAFTSYRAALDALSHAGVDPAQLAGLAVYRTGAPSDGLGVVLADALTHPLPSPTAPWTADEVFDSYCVFHTTVAMPEYQSGTPPYDSEGGGWSYDPTTHAPVVQRMETARLVVTVPRATMPASGWPTVVLVRTGAGGDRPLVDRGVQGVHNGPPLVAGSGPAQDYAHAGFAGVSVDGPLGGLRNTTGGDEQFLIFNVANLLALRDNIRQSALELALLARALDTLTLDASSCPGAVAPGGVARFDTHTMALMGHSMGSTIAPLVLAYEPRYRAAILSGAGGSWIENVMEKQSPANVRPVFELLLHYGSRALTAHDPALSLMQWSGEPADPPLYTRAIVSEPRTGAAPRDVLMVQGIVDTYILPDIANATSLSLGLDFAGTELDGSNPALAAYTPFSAVMDLAGRHAIALPAQGNVASAGGGAVTAVLVQAAQDSVEDGHEVAFQTPGPKHQYGCFLQGFAAGQTPRVPAPAGEFDPCP